MLTNSVLKTYPCVCAVRKNYEICIPVSENVLMKINVGDRTFYCHNNGVRISSSDIQKFIVPMDILDKAGKYTVEYEVMVNRGSYHCDKEPAVKLEFDFQPVKDKEKINIYHLSDVHGLGESAVKTGSYFGDELDLLILNGDISSSSDTVDEVILPFIIAGEITKGKIPVIISRGNHDLRGKFAEKLPEYMPDDKGKSYYPVSVGPLWCVLLDCGEDKNDSHREYSGTVCCHQFRLEESDMLKEITENAEKEYKNEKVKYKFVLSHVPFSYNNREDEKDNFPFDIEHEIFSDWCRFARDDIKADFMLSGHLHSLSVEKENSPLDNKGLNIPVIIGGSPDQKNNNVIGSAITLTKNNVTVLFTDKDKKIKGENSFKI